MKGQTGTARKLIPVLLASAALGLAQVNSLSDPGAQPQTPNSQNYSQQQAAPAPVGPGTVNYVEGQASLNGQSLSPQSIGRATVNPGETLTTSDGYVEMLLTPGAFLRVGHNSEVRLLSAGLADTNVNLARGSSMLEVDQIIKGTNLAVTINGATTHVDKKGLYVFNADEQTIRVLDGKLQVATPAKTQTLGKNNQISLLGEQAMKKENFDEKSVRADPLYVWSRARSQDEAQASEGAAANADSYAVAGNGWYWDPYFSSYGFWPVAGSLYSPFGFGFYSPAYFGFYGGGYGYYGRPFYGGGYYRGGWHGHPGYGWHGGRVGGVNARVSAFHGGSSGFHGGGGFHASGGGGFHGGGGGGHR